MSPVALGAAESITLTEQKVLHLFMAMETTCSSSYISYCETACLEINVS